MASNNSVFYEQVKTQTETRRDAGPADTADGLFQNMQSNNRGDVLIANALPSRTEIVRLGGSWGAQMLTAVAAVTGIPTTAAQHLMRNGNAAGGKSFIIDKIYYHVAVTGIDVDGAIKIMASVIPVQAAVSAAQAITVNSLSGWGAYNGLATFDDANTLAADKGWFTLPGATINGIGGAVQFTADHVLSFDLDGLIIVPPGGGLALSAQAVDTTFTGFPGFIWHEAVIGLP